MTHKKCAISLRLIREAREALERVDEQASVELEIKGQEYVSPEMLTCDQELCKQELIVLSLHVQTLGQRSSRHLLSDSRLNDNEVEVEHVAPITHSSAIIRLITEQERAHFGNHLKREENARKSRAKKLVSLQKILKYQKEEEEAKKSCKSKGEDHHRCLKTAPPPFPCRHIPATTTSNGRFSSGQKENSCRRRRKS